MTMSAPTHALPLEPSPPLEKMPGHWLLARMGKRILRPGGRELTQRLMQHLQIGPRDHVVEFAPGLGVTARLALARQPASYTAVERDAAAAAGIRRMLSAPNHRCISGTAEQTGMPDGVASVVYGEAMLSMQMPAAKERIVAEAARLLRPGGRYGIHELCLVPDDVPEEVREAIARDLSDDIHVGVKPLTARQWRELLQSAGLAVTVVEMAPMHLLEPARVFRDEGLVRGLRFFFNVARNPAARQRTRRMRNVFRKYREHLAAIAVVAAKP
jgi:SAM-dependent methyltransferase